MGQGETVVDVLLGAVVTVVLTPLVPLAPVAGGAVAGYLHGGTREDGLKIGALAGAVALVPLLVLAVFLANVLLLVVGGTVGVPNVLAGVGIAFAVLGVVFAAVYTVGLSALGGYLGNYVRYDTDIGDTPRTPGDGRP